MVGQQIEDRNLSILMKVLSGIFGLGICVIGIMHFVLWTIDTPIDFMLAVYFILFGITGIICEFPVPKFAVYFSFLKKYFGKGLFFVFMGTITMELDNWWHILISFGAIVTGIVYIVFSISHRDKMIEEDGTKNEEAPAEEKKPNQA